MIPVQTVSDSDCIEVTFSDNIRCHISNDHHDDQEKGLATKRSELLSEKPIVPNRYRPATSSSAYNEDHNADNDDEKS